MSTVLTSCWYFNFFVIFRRPWTKNSTYYSDTLINKVELAVEMSSIYMGKGAILLHDNACPHIAQLTHESNSKFTWEILPHPLFTVQTWLHLNSSYLVHSMRCYVVWSFITPMRSKKIDVYKRQVITITFYYLLRCEFILLYWLFM